MAADLSHFGPGSRLGDRYRIVELLGRGGRGEVYHAEDLKLRQPVAIKVLPAHLDRRPAVLERFLDEVRIARQITHPNVCRVYDVGEFEGRHFVSMELISGGDLASLLERVGRLPSAKVLAIGREIAQGLDAIHQQGIVHRDLKPSNLMLDARGRVRITGFGIAEVADDIDSLEVSLGTPAYMAPEQLDGETVTSRSDLYSLGLVLYELVTGRPGFVAENLAELFTRRREELMPAPPEAIVEDLDPVLARIIRRCLAVDPRQRPASALAVATALGDEVTLDGTVVRALLIGRQTGAEDVSSSPPSWLAAELLELHGGREMTTEEGLRLALFERPWNAVQHALAIQQTASAAVTGAEPEVRMGIHVGELAVRLLDGRPVVSGNAVAVAQALLDLAGPRQVLLSRSAFDLARRYVVDRDQEDLPLRWLAHGAYEMPRTGDEPCEIFEIGVEGTSLLTAPPSSPAGRAVHAGDAILGWRAAPGLEVPQRSSWHLERKLGEGGFGEVWLGRHAGTGERRVFKFCYEAAQLRSLQREITLFRLLKEELGERPDIARVLDWNFDAAPYFLEVEHTDGGSLVEWAEDEGGLATVPLSERLAIVTQVATALQAAHSVGVLHKDVKPANILMRRFRGGVRAQLADFGVGAVVERARLKAAGITVAGLTVEVEESSSHAGTRLYMAPEVLEGKVATVQADVYALGVLLYQMVVGDFTRALAPGWERDVADPLLREDIAEAVDGLPERRLANAGLLAERIRGLEERRRERLERESRLRQERRSAERMRRYRFGTLLLLGLLVAGALHVFVLQREFRRTASFLKIAVANDWLQRDPTLAGQIVLEVEDPEAEPFIVDLTRQILQQPLALAELEHDDRIAMADFDARGERVLTASRDASVRLWDTAGGEILATLLHDGPVRSARFDPDGERILTASEDGAARLFGSSPWRPLRTFQHADIVTDARFAPDGERVVTACVDGAVQVWNLLDDEPPILLRHGAPVRQALFLPAGDRILTASTDGTARLWSLETPDEPRVFRHDGAIVALALDPRGERFVSTSLDQKVRLWSLESGRAVVLKEEYHGALPTAAFAPDGNRVAVASFNTIWAWKLRDLQPVGDPLKLEGHNSSILSLVFSENGEHLLSASHDGTARSWSLTTNNGSRLVREEMVLRGHRDRVTHAAIGPRGNLAVTTSWDGTARLWNIRPQEPGIVSHPGELRSLDISPRKDRFLTAARQGTVRVWSLQDPTTTPLEVDVGVPITRAIFAPDGGQIAIAATDGLLRLWNLGETSPRELAGHQAAIRQVAYSPDGAWIGTASEDGTARIWATHGAISIPLEHGSAVLAITFDPQSRRVATGTAGGLVHLWGFDDGELRRLEGHEASIEELCFSPGGELLASASADATARIWTLDDDREPRILRSELAVHAIAFSPSGNRLLTASGDETVRVWDLRDETEEPLILHHRRVGGVLQATFDGRGERIVSATDDGSVWVWALPGDPEPVVLRGHSDTVWAVTFHPDGDRVLSASGDGTARVWQLDPSKLSSLLQRSTRLCLDTDFRRDYFAESPAKAQERFVACKRKLDHPAPLP